MYSLVGDSSRAARERVLAFARAHKCNALCRNLGT